MARTLDDQVYQQAPYPPNSSYGAGFSLPTPGPVPPPPPSFNQNNWSPWGVNVSNSAYTEPNQAEVTQSLANLSMAPTATYLPPPPPPQFQQTPKVSSPPPALPSLTASLPILAQLQTAATVVQSPNHDPALKIAWCRDILFLVDRSQGTGTPSTDPPIGPISISDPALARLAQIAVPLILQISNTNTQGQKMPPYVAEAISMRANLAATGAFPEFIRHNPRAAFRDFEAAARGGFAAAWFRLGRDYENFNDHAHARDCFERGIKLGVESCLYRMGMAHLLGQLSLPSNPTMALPLLHRAATLASLTCPQPAYVYSLLLLSEFTQITVPPTLFAPFIPQGSSPTLEARKHLERAAYLHFPAAQYKLGHAYEFAEPPFPFDALLSVQYYSLASQQGEVEADMALSKWFLCGSGGAAVAGKSGPDSTHGGFEKDESLALTFAEKAARKGLPSAEFAMGYYAEVGVGRPKDLKTAMMWYSRARDHGNEDAAARLTALSSSSSQALSRQEHDTITEAKLVRRRTMAAQRAETQPVSPPWEGTTFPTVKESQQQGFGQSMGVAGMGGISGKRREDGRLVVDVVRKNSLATGYSGGPGHPQGGYGQPPSSAPANGSRPPRDQSPQRLGYGPQRTDSPSGRKTPPAPVGGRPPSPGRRQQQNSSTGSANGAIGSNSLVSRPPGRNQSPGPPGGGGRLARIRLNLDDPGVSPSPASPSVGGPVSNTPSHTTSYNTPPSAPATTTSMPSNTSSTRPSAASTPAPVRPANANKPQTFAEMGFHGTKVEDEKCVIM